MLYIHCFCAVCYRKVMEKAWSYGVRKLGYLHHRTQGLFGRAPSIRENSLGTRLGYLIPISFREHARSQVKGGHSSGEIKLIHVEFPT